MGCDIPFVVGHADLMPTVYKQIRMPGDVPLELKPAPNGKGWGAFATRPIDRRAEIVSERPLFLFSSPPEGLSVQDYWRLFDKVPPLAIQPFNLLIGISMAYGRGIEGAFLMNSFVREKTTVVCSLLPRCNHSCIPNAEITLTLDDWGLRLMAIKDIAAGEEVSFGYHNHQSQFECMTRYERASELFAKSQCRCEVCVPGSSLQP